MHYYKYKDCVLAAKDNLNMSDHYESIDLESLTNYKGEMFYIDKRDLSLFRSKGKILSPSFFTLNKEDLNILRINEDYSIVDKITEKTIKDGRMFYINSSNNNWPQLLEENINKKWRISVVGLGDVGGTLITGLRLLGGDCVESIGIYDRDPNKIKRWTLEANQIFDINSINMPPIIPLKEEDIFNCDMFVFCVSVGVPEVGKEQKDVRLVQFEGNAKILSYYAKKARDSNFKGLFSVVSDPVDLLCKVAFNESNKNSEGEIDHKGLASHQIKGYGLGVMNARAAYYASIDEETLNYVEEGRAFGPHGEGLVIANSINNYDEELSNKLTLETKKANLEVRASGFKPYIAPALSSGALSLIATIKGQWHYSCNFIGGVFMGCKNRETPYGLELESYDFDPRLFNKLCNTYNYLKSLYF